MNIYEYISRDQNLIVSLINELLDINLHSVQQRFFDDIKSHLIMHIEAKRKVFYPAIVDQGDLQNVIRDDAEILDLLQSLTDEGMTSPKWMVMFGELKHAVERQAAQTENDLFSKSRRSLTPDQANSIPQQMEAIKRKLAEEHNLSVTHVATS